MDAEAWGRNSVGTRDIRALQSSLEIPLTLSIVVAMAIALHVGDRHIITGRHCSWRIGGLQRVCERKSVVDEANPYPAWRGSGVYSYVARMTEVIDISDPRMKNTTSRKDWIKRLVVRRGEIVQCIPPGNRLRERPDRQAYGSSLSLQNPTGATGTLRIFPSSHARNSCAASGTPAPENAFFAKAMHPLARNRTRDGLDPPPPAAGPITSTGPLKMGDERHWARNATCLSS